MTKIHPFSQAARGMALSLALVAMPVSIAAFAASFVFAADSPTPSPKDKYGVRVPGGLAFSEFKGFESWEAISISSTEKAVAVILGNPIMISAFKSGFPSNGQPAPDGARMAKIHWAPRKNQFFPNATVPGTQQNVDFMVKDSKRFTDSGGWGYAVFDYNAATDTFTPGTMAGSPPQGNDAKCGFACHTIVKSRDYVFTDYGHR